MNTKVDILKKILDDLIDIDYKNVEILVNKEIHMKSVVYYSEIIHLINKYRNELKILGFNHNNHNLIPLKR